MSATLTIFKRELRSYFATPVAYVFIVIFLLLSGAFTFYLGNFYERGQADLQPFFNFHPWLYLFLVPAVSMRDLSRLAPMSTAAVAVAAAFATSVIALCGIAVAQGQVRAAWGGTQQ